MPVRSTLSGVVLALAAAGAAADDPAIPRESVDRFLGGVRDFPGTKAAPAPQYVPPPPSEPQFMFTPATPGARGVTLVPAPPAQTHYTSGTLPGGTITQRPISPYVINSPPLERRQVTPYNIQSPWGDH